ncbi:MAG: hypothetical protein ACRELA_07925 [Candidatus Rokuibacteriota bacterium]
MLILATSCFLHVPKTGGTWVKAAIAAARIPFEEFTIDGDVHADLSYCPRPERFKFAFVRHPVQFYRSYWQFKMGVGWDPRNPLDVDCAAANFHAFVGNVLLKYPGMCAQLFQDYVGPPGRDIEFIGRYERLADDLIAVLKMAGEHVDEDAIRRCPPQNVSNQSLFPAEYTRVLENAVRRSEAAAIERFGYD